MTYYWQAKAERAMDELTSALAKLTTAQVEIDRLTRERDQARRWARAWRLLAEEYRDSLREAWNLRFLLKWRDRQIDRVTRQWWREKQRADTAEAALKAIIATADSPAADGGEMFYAEAVGRAVEAARKALEGSTDES